MWAIAASESMAGSRDECCVARDPSGIPCRYLSLDPAMLSDAAIAHIRALDEIARGRGQSLAQMALAWALRDPRVTSLVAGASSVAQLEQNVAALQNLEFSADELAAIDRHAVDAGIDLWAMSRGA